jgi:S-disulfanyl-L-cysteine oxidoreductase SoxD
VPTRVLSILLVVSVVVSVAGMSAQQRTTWDGVFTTEQARRGEALYKTHCGSCHGDILAGIESAPQLVGDTFNATWDGVPLNELFERMRMTMPQTKPGSLSRAQNADILAYILDVAKFPAGSAVLDAQVLDGITYRTYRP